MTEASGEERTQTSEDFVQDYDGLKVPCPFCAENDVDWQPFPFLSRGSCHNCNREFEVIVRWSDEEEAAERHDSL